MCVCRQYERAANVQYNALHSDVAGAELIELPAGANIPHLCNIVLMRGSIYFSSADVTTSSDYLLTADSQKVRS